ncbi:hypothetical protein HanPI659440_Chr04g0159671 [Helianthus annuus]|nr:hypothetical protein HanPI659440_Chr04g0159671 [Helianthus annuus]
MGMRKGLHIVSTDFSETVEDHGEANVEDHGEADVEDHDTYDNVEDHGKMQGCQSNSHEGNEYMKLRELTIQENNKRLRELGTKNIINSPACLEGSQKMKKKTVKKQNCPQYIPPMSSNRVANIMKLRRVVAPNVSQKLPSTSNATSNATKPTVTMSEIIKGNKEGAKKKLVLVDEDDEMFQVDDVGQHVIRMADHDYSKDEDNVHEQ